ncbi:hypothetical protein BTJ40_21200 [Microbulbifer sp. A4B17]|nr:hypothetical protein BTJ40_21200 [Microbulbifer sp. A4B17]
MHFSGALAAEEIFQFFFQFVDLFFNFIAKFLFGFVLWLFPQQVVVAVPVGIVGLERVLPLILVFQAFPC